MVLFVFEGTRPEYMLFESINNLFLKHGDDYVKCTFSTNIYVLYEKIHREGVCTENVDTVLVLKEWLKEQNKHDLDNCDADSFSEIYLFFDYDPHAAISCNVGWHELNERVEKMLRLFDDETNHGKLYVSYPMSEAFRYTKRLPDKNYYAYTYKIQNCSSFKKDSSEFSYYKNNNFVSYNHHRDGRDDVKNNLEMLCMQNVAKANYICSGKNETPSSKNEVCQRLVFESQINKYVIPHKEVSILCAFSLFLFEYLKPGILPEY